MGKIKNKVLTGHELTDEYQDYETRLDNVNKTGKRYLALLVKAENVEAALQVEKELERLNNEIDLFKGTIEPLKHLVRYPNIDINIQEKRKTGILGYVGTGIYRAMR